MLYVVHTISSLPHIMYIIIYFAKQRNNINKHLCNGIRHTMRPSGHFVQAQQINDGAYLLQQSRHSFYVIVGFRHLADAVTTQGYTHTNTTSKTHQNTTSE